MVAARADAQRNRHRLLEVARRMLVEGACKTPLEAIAREAGVGIGTLYRHFPTREELVEAVYRDELDRLCASATPPTDGISARTALRAWMDRFADYIAAKREMADALRAVFATGAVVVSQTRAAVAAAVQVYLDAGIVDGSLRDDVRAEDVVMGLVGIFLACDPERDDRVARMMDLLLAGITPRTG